jgi:hypothetical protein
MHHTTVLTDEGKWSCTCEGWRYRYNCRHVNDLKVVVGDEPDEEVQVSL